MSDNRTHMRAFVTGLLLLALVIGSPRAYAEEAAVTLNDETIATIRANCLTTQVTLNRIHESDALARVNLGQQYETISTKLMAPLNSRVALNRLNGVALTQVTVEFNAKLDEFRSLYQQYEQTLLRAIQIKCTDQPVRFYDTLTLARTHRAAVREAVVSLGDLVTRYGEEVGTLRADIKEKRP